MKPDNICQNLRTKKMFIPGQEDETFAREAQGSPHCWCVRTMSEVGPDDRQVGIKICDQSRSCFEE